jgi:hypothetical protein
MALYVRQTTFASGEKLFAAQLNTEFDTILNSLNSVATQQIVAGAVTNTQLAANAVTADKINDDAVTSPKIGFTSSMMIALDYASAERISGAIFHNQGDSAISLVSARLTCSTAPTGNETIKVWRLDDAYTDPDTHVGSAVVFTAGDPTLASAKKSSQYDISSNGTLSPGEAWVFESTVVNGAGDVSLHLEIGR